MISSFIVHKVGRQARKGLCPIWRPIARVDCRHEMLSMTFLDPGTFELSRWRGGHYRVLEGSTIGDSRRAYERITSVRVPSLAEWSVSGYDEVIGAWASWLDRWNLDIEVDLKRSSFQ